jgi:hypothetical protein
MTTTIYILKLQENKYYIGKTNNFEKKKKEHFNGYASLWTKKYKPISVEKIINNTDPFDEDKITLEYMALYGIDNVRGGIYITEKLDENQLYTIKRSIWSANDCCMKCGKLGHFINNCTETIDIYGENIYKKEEFNCKYCDKKFITNKEKTFHENLRCEIKIINKNISYISFIDLDESLINNDQSNGFSCIKFIKKLFRVI